MRAVLLGLLLATVGLSGPTHAQELFPLQQVQTVNNTGCTPAGSPCPVGGPDVPAGMHWNMVNDTEFTQYTTANPPLFWTQNGSTLPNGQLCGLTFDSTNGASIDGSAACLSDPSLNFRASLASPVAPYGTTTVWHFGYFEILAKNAHYDSGLGFAPHTDFWFRSYPNTNVVEDDVNEAYHQTDLHYTGYGIADPCITCPAVSVYYPGTTLLDQSFNTYGRAWMNDGSAHGSDQVFFNGGAISAPYDFQSSSIDTGMKIIMSEDFANFYNPFQIKYIRIWQLAPN